MAERLFELPSIAGARKRVGVGEEVERPVFRGEIFDPQALLEAVKVYPATGAVEFA